MRPWSSALLSLDLNLPAVSKVPGVSPELPSSPKITRTLGKQAMPGDSLAVSPGVSEMSLAVLAWLSCRETGLQKPRAQPACLDTSEVWVLRGRIPPPAVNLSTAPAEQSTTQPGPRPGTEGTVKCPAECHSQPSLSPLALSRALRVTQVPLMSPTPQSPTFIFP